MAGIINVPLPADGDTQFTRGMNSQLDPLQLVTGFYRAAMNMVNRGGSPQCRPGYDWMFNLPDGDIQGAHLFSPTNDLEQLLFAVSGLVYMSQYPYADYCQLKNLQFRDDVETIFFCTGNKAVQVQDDGTLKLITPFKLVVVQDGLTAPGVWDGFTDVHETDPLGVPIGGPMAWVGDRLHVAREKEIFTCDINDPLSNREGKYIALAKSFTVDRPITAMAEAQLSGTSYLLAFSAENTWSFQMSIRTRTAWETTPNFQFCVFPFLGCVASRSVVTMNGLLWWYSKFGLTNFNAAQSTYINSEFAYQDLEMAASKAYIGDNQQRIALATFENYLLVSVPYADKYNAHTWVLDKTPVESINLSSPQAWNAYWTGTRPTDWVFGNVGGRNRIFQFSKDYDGTNRLWEAFSDERTDNGCPITWSLETRAYTGQTVVEKEHRFAQISLFELEGDVDVAVFWSGVSKGSYKRCLTKRIRANTGIIVPGMTFTPTMELFSLKKQSRKLVTIDVKTSPQEVTTCGVESTQKESLDSGFQLLIIGSGPAAIRGVREFMTEQKDLTSGKCEQDETKDNFVRYDGAGSNEQADLNEPPEIFTSSDTEDVTVLDVVVESDGDAKSLISQQDADKVSRCHEANQTRIWQQFYLPKLIGNPPDA